MKDAKIDINSNNLQENDEVEKKAVDIEFNEQKAFLKMMRMLLTFYGQM